jgi:hypothetical protein
MGDQELDFPGHKRFGKRRKGGHDEGDALHRLIVSFGELEKKLSFSGEDFSSTNPKFEYPPAKAYADQDEQDPS